MATPAFPGKLSISMRDTGGEKVEENLGYVNVNLLDSTTPTETGAAVRTFAVQVANLTTNSYVSGQVEYTVDLEQFDE